MKKLQSEKKQKNILIKKLFKVLSIVAKVRPQAWPSLIDGLVDDAVLQFSPDGD